jgi:nucleotidyltransferase substrate binding protein (TIGR01987 family)
MKKTFSPDDARFELALSKLKKVLLALEGIVLKPMQEDRSNIDAAIQRFEFTIELFWRFLKVILDTKGLKVVYPKDVLKESFKGGLIHHEQQWLSMLADRNLTSHTYDERIADAVFHRICEYVPLLRKTFNQLEKN